MNHFFIFGTHPLLSLAEVKALIGGRRPLVMERMAVIDVDDWDGKTLNDRLGGTVKLGDVVAEVPVADLDAKRLADELDSRPREKKTDSERSPRIEFGLTVYGDAKARERFKKLPLQLKRALQERGHAVRWVTGERGELSPAAVAKAHLIDEGFDLVIGLDGKTAHVGLTTHVQDADAWSKRDYGRPFRDDVTGMLPPKLARMMVNLAVGVGADPRVRPPADGQTRPRGGQTQGSAPTVFDPFCGGGTVLMEAALVGVPTIIGSDIDEQQVECTNQNLDWLVKEKILTKEWRASIRTFISPAETVDRAVRERVTIVTEGYLGKPLTGHETLETLRRQKKEIETIWRDSLASFAKIQKTGDPSSRERRGDRIVCVWPVWVSSHGVVAVDLKDDVASYGYRLLDPLAGWIDKPVTLTYARENQRVKRNIVVMERV